MKPLKTAAVNFNSTGDNIVVAAQTGCSIFVYGISLTATTATNLTMYSKTPSGTALSGAYDLQANGSMTFVPGDSPLWVTNPGEAFVINQSGTASVQGTVYFSHGLI